MSDVAVIHGQPITVPVSKAVTEAIHAWQREHAASLDEALAPFSLSTVDLLQVDYMRFVREDEMETLVSGDDDARRNLIYGV